jgi:hypothetical protein
MSVGEAPSPVGFSFNSSPRKPEARCPRAWGYQTARGHAVGAPAGLMAWADAGPLPVSEYFLPKAVPQPDLCRQPPVLSTIPDAR